MDLSKILSYSLPSNAMESRSSSSSDTLETTTLRPEQLEDVADTASSDLPPNGKYPRAPAHEKIPNLVIDFLYGRPACLIHPSVWSHSGGRWLLAEDARLSFMLENLNLHESWPAVSQILNRDDDSIHARIRALAQKSTPKCVDCIRLEESVKVYRQNYFRSVLNARYNLDEGPIEVIIPPPRHIACGDPFPLPVVIKADSENRPYLSSVHISLDEQPHGSYQRSFPRKYGEQIAKPDIDSMHYPEAEVSSANLESMGVYRGVVGGQT
uniref:Uncharacterized protein n=1 Tax=Talaromyces marneffei PM1 TaxID=1077442 RepID=A0A093V767_TALMA